MLEDEIVNVIENSISGTYIFQNYTTRFQNSIFRQVYKKNMEQSRTNLPENLP